jgi:hypothetical protein
MSEEQKTPEVETKKPAVEEVKVQAKDLTKTISDILHEGMATRITVVRKERTLIDIPLAIGVASSVVLAIYLPVISAIAGVCALLGGCTVRIEREQPPHAS